MRVIFVLVFLPITVSYEQELEKAAMKQRFRRESLSLYDQHAKVRYAFNRAKKQHAIDEMVFGCTLLRPPQNRVEEDWYVGSSYIFCTSSGEYFTTLKPVPPYLRPLVTGVKPLRLEAHE